MVIEMSSVARKQLETVERELCSELDIDLEHEPDGDRSADERWWDAVLEEPVTSCCGRAPLGTTEIPPGRLEIKTCQLWISDYSCSRNRRRGRWTVHWNNHQTRLDEDAATLLVLLEDDSYDGEALAVRAVTLATAAAVDGLLEGRWTTGDGSGRGRSAQLPWPEVFPTDDLDEDPVAMLDVERGEDT